MTTRLENKYIVIKRDKLAHFFEIIRLGRASNNHDHNFDQEYFKPISFIDAFELEVYLNSMMAIQGHDYFVLNLDEPAAVTAVEKYFRFADEDKLPEV